MTHEDHLVTLTAWMAENDYSAADIAYAVEKPHKYEDELAQAKAALEEETKVEQGVIWDDPDSPEAARCRQEIRGLSESLRADRIAGYPSESERGQSDPTPAAPSGTRPSLRLVAGRRRW